METFQDYEIVRSTNFNDYFVGDIVKIYNTDVNTEINQDTALIHDKADDIGLVISHCKGNPYWRQVYCWKTKTIRSIVCSKLYWFADDKKGGRALHIHNATGKLKEYTPEKLLSEYKAYFSCCTQ